MLDTLRQPEYTGENRCLPCTVVNTVIALALAVAAGWGLAAADTGVTVGLAVGTVVLAVSVALIYFRGYLVPGTPELTKRYFPPWLLRAFGKEPAPSGGPIDDLGTDEGTDTRANDGDDAGGKSEVDVEQFLLAVDAVEPCADRDDLCLTEAFRSTWNAEIERVREAGVDAETLVADLGLAVSAYTIETHGDGRVLRTDGQAVGQWPSPAALVADSAAATVLSERADEWAALAPEARGQVLSGLRIFLEDCPTGEGGVAFGERTVESCCSTHQVVAVTCEETGERLFEQPLSQ